MAAGRLNQRVSIEAETVEDDGLGGQTRAWQAVASVWAEVRPERGSEKLQAGRVQAQQAYVVLMRHRSDITEQMALVWQGRRLNIRSIANTDMREKYVELMCEEGVAV